MDSSPLRKHLDAQNWSDVYSCLVAFAEARLTTTGQKARRKKTSTTRDARAKDLAQEAIARIYAFDSKWDPEKEPSPLRYLMSTVNSLLANERTSAAAKRNISHHEEPERVAQVRDERALSEEKASAADLLTQRVALLKTRLADDPHALRVLDLALDGIDSPAEIGAATGWPLATVTTARLRMQRHAERVAREIGADEDEETIAIPHEIGQAARANDDDDDDRTVEVA